MAQGDSTISNVYVRAVVAALRGDQPRLFRVLFAAGLSPYLMDAPKARVSAQSFAALWLAVAKELDDELLGVDSRRMKRGSFAVICQPLIHAGTLERGIRQFLRGLSIIFDDLQCELLVQDHTATLRLANRIADPDEHIRGSVLFLVIVLGVICWLAGLRVPLALARFDHAEPDHVAEYRLIFGPDLQFDAAQTELSFSAHYLKRSVVQDEAGLKQFLRDAPQSVFIKYRNTEGWVARVRRDLRRLPGEQWPTFEAMANALNVASSTLRRRLEAENSSYSEIKDALRRDRAIELLAHTDQSIEAIASGLGYQEVSAFYRAFKHWTGSRPSAYRSETRH